MFKFEVISVNNSHWSKIISLAKWYDFYHTLSYSRLVEGGEPVLCFAHDKNNFIALPLVIRKIENTLLYDCTSVYGYCGPVSNLESAKIPEELIIFFQHELWSFFKKRNIISAFSRLHPLLYQDRIFNQFGIVKEINKTIAIDLKLSEEQQWSNYRESHRRYIKQLRKNSFVVIKSNRKKEIDEFESIYAESMKRLNSDPSLIFTNRYFHKLLTNSCFESDLLLVKKEEVIIAGGIFTHTNNIMQYHLSGVRTQFISYSPIKLLIDEARKLGNEYHLDFLHLGGGLHGSSEDSLFYFKAGFSDVRFVYKTWQLIINKEKYNDLVQQFNIDPTKAENYFPAYRAY